MKKTLLALALISSVAAANAGSMHGNDWANVISAAIAPPPVVVVQQPVYAPAPVYIAPQPVYIQPSAPQFGLANAALSPDGRWIQCTYYDGRRLTLSSTSGCPQAN